MNSILDHDALVAALVGRPGWSGDTKSIARSIEAPGFLDGIRLVDAVALVAEVLDHHPDIDVRWRTVTFALSTHSEGGVTDKDIELARRIDALATEHFGR